MPDWAELGDVISVAGVYADGTHAPDAGPINPAKPVQSWRVVEFDGDDVRLQPLNPDGTVNHFLDATGEYWIRGPEGPGR